MFFIRGTNDKKVTYGFLCSYFVGWKVSDEQLREVAELSGVLQVHDDYLDSVFRAQCERLLPDPSNLEPADCGTAFLFLCEHI
jgi:hypothetical protein